MAWWQRRRYDPYEVIDLPAYGIAILPNPKGMKATERGDTDWIVSIGDAIRHADAARAHPSEEARDLAAGLLADTTAAPDAVPDAERVAGEVQWGLAFARHDPHRLLERPAVAHESYIRELVNRTLQATGPERFLADACRQAFVYGRGGPGAAGD